MKKVVVFTNNSQIFAVLFEENNVMRVCDLTGKRPMVGNNVSHSNRRTKRRFYPNLQEKKFFIPEENRWITLKVSTKAIKTINKKGIAAVLNDYVRNGIIK